MKEGEIEDKDGNKFKVFWPKGKPCDTHGITEKGVEGCCPIGHKGIEGTKGIPAGAEGETSKPSTKGFGMGTPPPSLKKLLEKYVWGESLQTIPIDDSLEKDIVESPVKGRIYKIRQINVIARYMGTHLVTADEGKFQQIVYETRFRDMTLFVCKGDLLRATEAEVATFLEK